VVRYPTQRRPLSGQQLELKTLTVNTGPGTRRTVLELSRKCIPGHTGPWTWISHVIPACTSTQHRHACIHKAQLARQESWHQRPACRTGSQSLEGRPGRVSNGWVGETAEGPACQVCFQKSRTPWQAFRCCPHGMALCGLVVRSCTSHG